MSTRDRLAKLTADILQPTSMLPAAEASPAPRQEATSAEQKTLETKFPPPALETRFPPADPRTVGKRTGPGELLAFRGQMLAAEGEVAKLKELLQQHEGAFPTKKINPELVHGTRWANRHAASFEGADFLRFKADIEHAGGNTQPILVQPHESKDGEYELVFGHRRHRACLETRLPVLATLLPQRLPELDLFVAMERENRERKDLSAWEQGMHYRRALESGLFPSMRRLAEHLGVSHTWVRKTLTVAELPDAIVQCFESPLELQFKHAEEISKALQEDKRSVLKRAEKLRQGPRLSAGSVVLALLGKQRLAPTDVKPIKVGDRMVGGLKWDNRGRALIQLEAGMIHDGNAEAVINALIKAAAAQE